MNISSLSSFKAIALRELAPFHYVLVAGLHRALPSASLYKSIAYLINLNLNIYD